MEEALKSLAKEASGNKHRAVREACCLACDTLDSHTNGTDIPPHQLREKCLTPFRLALESKNTKLSQYALAGVQRLLAEERFVSRLPEEKEEHRLLSQVLETVHSTPALHEDLQVEVMKVLLCLACSSTFELNGKSLLQISEVCVDTYVANSHLRSTNTAVRATLSQMLGDLSQSLRQKQEEMQEADGERNEEKVANAGNMKLLMALRDDVVSVLAIFCDKLQGVVNGSQQMQLLYLECILALLSNFSSSMHIERSFTDLVWKQLCPTLVVLLGNPMQDRVVASSHNALQQSDATGAAEAFVGGGGSGFVGGVAVTGGPIPLAVTVSDQGRGSGCCWTAPALLAPVVRTVCSLAAELVRLVGALESLRPVLQSLYHRMLLYPPPQHRIEALKVLRESLSSPQRLFELAAPTVPDGVTRRRLKRKTHLDLLKLIMDGVSEACVKGGVESGCAAVSCVWALLGSLDSLSRGQGLCADRAAFLLAQREQLSDGCPDAGTAARGGGGGGNGSGGSGGSSGGSASELRLSRLYASEFPSPSEPCDERAERSPDISISVARDTSDEALGEQERETPSEDAASLDREGHTGVGGGGGGGGGGAGGGGGGSIISGSCGAESRLEERGHSIHLPTEVISNLLSVSSRLRCVPASVSGMGGVACGHDDHDLCRAELDSCDRYSMLVERDSARSDLSELGSSENISLADDDGTAGSAGSCAVAGGGCGGGGIGSAGGLGGAGGGGGGGSHHTHHGRLSQKLLRDMEAECENARLFVHALASVLPRMLQAASAEDIDQQLQTLASNFTTGMLASSRSRAGRSAPNHLLLNGDSLYALSLLTLLLNLKLVHAEYYRGRCARAPVSQREFAQQLQCSGIMLVLSNTWLEEVYNQVRQRNLLGEAGYRSSTQENASALVTMLTDLDGLGSNLIGGQMVFEVSGHSPLACNRYAEAQCDSVSAGASFARTILVGCWRNLIDILSAPLGGWSRGGTRGLSALLGGDGAREQRQREREAVCLSLDGLRKAARLSCQLGVAANCASALAQMADASCVLSERDEREITEPSDSISHVRQKVEQKLEQMGRPAGVRLHAAHALCMEAILDVGLEMGSHASECWHHVFRVCEYISALEHSHFCEGGTSTSRGFTRPPRDADPLAATSPGRLLDEPGSPGHTPGPAPGLGSSGFPGPFPGPQSPSVQELIGDSAVRPRGSFDFGGNGGVLTPANMAKVICSLSTEVDRLFEEAAYKLNLAALVGFLQQLRRASQAQLFDSVAESTDYALAMPVLCCAEGVARSTQGRRSALHLFRLGDTMLRVVRDSRRPLLHLFRTWAVVAPHLVEAACHKERHVSQKAVSFLHDILTEVLSSRSELPHFHMGEALFRPFQHIMQLELCDEDVQDQVITSIGELVEACASRIQSGWRPLFGALRTVHASRPDAKEYLIGEYTMGKSRAPVFDVFEAFLSTDSVQVFANAAVDCILCLIKFVQGLGEGDGRESCSNAQGSSGYSSLGLCLPALDYLRQCSQLLSKIYEMPSRPMFHGAHLAGLTLHGAETGTGTSEDSPDTPETPGEFDDGSGLVCVWSLLLEHLASAVSACPRQNQPPTLSLLFYLLRAVAHLPGPKFGMYAVTHLLLPVMTLWLQRSHSSHAYWEEAAANFKHAIGLCSELVVEHVHNFTQMEIGFEGMVSAMLRQLFRLLVACISEPAEAISRVGCSCIRYLLVSAGPVFTDEMWKLACSALQDAFAATLQPVKDLLSCFQSGSDSFGGDACEVKVAAPHHSDSVEAEYWRIRAMAQQVFLLESQCVAKTPSSKEGLEHAQSCVLIIEVLSHAGTRASLQKRIPFRSIVVRLLSHQVLLQNLLELLLLDEPAVPPGSGSRSLDGSCDDHSPVSVVAPLQVVTSAPFLRHISMLNLSLVFDLLLDSYRAARDFDTRPGLKYLLMKVSGMGAPANLYRQAAMSLGVYGQALLAALQLLARDDLSAEQVKRIVAELEQEDNESSDSSLGSPSEEDHQQQQQEEEDEEHEQPPAAPIITTSTTVVTPLSVLAAAPPQPPQPPQPQPARRQRGVGSRATPQHRRAPSLGVQPANNADWCWLVKRLHRLCLELCQTYIQMHLDLEGAADGDGASGAAGGGGRGAVAPETLFLLPVFPLEPAASSLSSTSKESFSSGDTVRSLVTEEVDAERAGGGGPPTSPRAVDADADKDGKRRQQREWWESTGGKIYTVATDRTISKLVAEYKRRKQQHTLTTFVREPTRPGPAANADGSSVKNPCQSTGGQRSSLVLSPRPQQQAEGTTGPVAPLGGPGLPCEGVRPAGLAGLPGPGGLGPLGEGGPLPPRRSSSTSGPETPRSERFPRSRSASQSSASPSGASRDSEAQLQAWTNMVLMLLNQLLGLPEPAFVALQPAIFPSLSQLTCHVTDSRVRQAVRDWLGRLGRVYSIIA
ncbi:LOW QUALITY PROTEIN: brefeldin A-inhibited guanine nucleotide-exchange protein 3 [Lampetra planeri]